MARAASVKVFGCRPRMSEATIGCRNGSTTTDRKSPAGRVTRGCYPPG
jgi:hypothetical protein